MIRLFRRLKKFMPKVVLLPTFELRSDPPLSLMPSDKPVAEVSNPSIESCVTEVAYAWWKRQQEKRNLSSAAMTDPFWIKVNAALAHQALTLSARVFAGWSLQLRAGSERLKQLNI